MESALGKYLNFEHVEYYTQENSDMTKMDTDRQTECMTFNANAS